MYRVPLIALIVLFSPGLLLAQKTWTQTVERQPVVERGQDMAEPADKQIAGIPDSAFSGGTIPKWIWGPDNNTNYVLRTTIELQDIKAARLRASCDNVGTVFINGKRVGGSSEWQEPVDADVASALVKGKNVIEAEVENQGAVAAFVLKLIVQPSTGDTIEVVTSETWTYSTKRDADSKDTVQLRGEYGGGPWGLVFNNAAMPGRVPAGVFEVLPGFQVDKLYTVPKDELGSWVCITFDNKGRLLVSDQGDKGLFRITLPPINGEGGVSVEHLDFSKCEVQPSGAQGMLWAFDSLYICCNGGPGSGLYRARDKDGDDQFDECVKLKDIRGGGEHGPHALRLSPDGKRIFLIAGNHTKPPFDAGEEQKNPD